MKDGLSLFQATLPNFPSRTEQQAKFINMVDRPINILAGEHQFPLQAFQVGLYRVEKINILVSTV